MAGRISKTRFALLGMLSNGPMTGYELKKGIESSIGYFWSESFGQIYPTLKTLVGEGLLRSDPGDEKTSYRITESGRRVLRDYLREPPGDGPRRDELLLKLFFGARVPPDTQLPALTARRETLVRELAEYDGIVADIKKQHGDHRDAPYWLITLRKGLISGKAELEWIDETIRTLKKLKRVAPAARDA